MRDREGYRETKHTFYGRVEQYREENTYAYGLISRDNAVDMYYQFIIQPLPDKRLVEGEFVTVYGKMKGLDTYVTVIGGTNTTPKIDIHEVFVEGIDY